MKKLVLFLTLGFSLNTSCSDIVNEKNKVIWVLNITDKKEIASLFQLGYFGTEPKSLSAIPTSAEVRLGRESKKALGSTYLITPGKHEIITDRYDSPAVKALIKPYLGDVDPKTVIKNWK